MRVSRTHQLLTMVLILSTVVVSHDVQALQDGPPQLGKDPLEAVIAAMTLDEKVSLLVGEGMSFGPPPAGEGEAGGGAGTPQAPPASTVGNSLNLVPGAAGTTTAIPRLGIPPTVLADGPAGLRISPTRPGDDATYHATAFPIATLLASSWDTDLVYRVGEAFGSEVLEYGVDILLAPALNIHRNPLGGRNFEYYSEDPLITGSMAAAMVLGVQSRGVGTAPKHFVANNQETNRTTVDVLVSQRALREIYLRGFRQVVEEARPWTVMSSYNQVNGTYTSHSAGLLTDVLRGDWGFRGYVMTDWFGGTDAVAQMQAGNDLLMPGTPEQRTAILEAVRTGELDEGVLDRNVEAVLRIILQTPRFRKYPYSNRPDLKAHSNVAREAASQGMVLLKNDNRALPLRPEAGTVALFGNAAYDTVIGGTGSGDVNEAYSISIHDGLEAAGFSLDGELAGRYTSYIEKALRERPKPKFWFLPAEPIAEMEVAAETIRSLADSSDAALVTLGRSSGEFGDRKEADDFNLSRFERELIKLVCHEFRSRGKRAVVVLNIGGVVETASWRADPDAILVAWQPGQEAGHAVADVLSGRINPSGRLASTFPTTYADIPSAANFPGVELPEPEGKAEPAGVLSAIFQGKPSEVTYAEDVYVGYRYHGTFDVAPSYEFGFGLSYSRFTYSDLELGPDSGSGKRSLSLRVTNAGEVAGREVVQVYVTSPAPGSPAKALAAFKKTGMLPPGDFEEVRLVLEPDDYAAFDTGSSSWVIEPGTYRVHVGASSRDVRLTDTFEAAQRRVVRAVRNVLAPRREIERLRP